MTMNATPTHHGLLRRIAMLILLAMPVPVAFAAPSKNAYFGENTTPNVIALLPTPPDVGTPEDAADRASSLAVYAARTPAQSALGKSQNKLSVFHFSPLIGPWFQKTKLPATDTLFAEIDREIAPLIEGAKKYYQRPRPAQVASDIFKDAIAKDDSGSYPGGHATRATLYGMLLAELFPQQRDAIMIQSRAIGWLRVTGGVETPLDVYAGRVFGRALAQALARNPGFLADFEAVREEIAAATAP